jgi:hypothetical protein
MATPIASTARQRARRYLRPLFVLVLVLRCVAALPPHRATASGTVDPRGPLGRVMALVTTPVQSAEQ